MDVKFQVNQGLLSKIKIQLAKNLDVGWFSAGNIYDGGLTTPDLARILHEGIQEDTFHHGIPERPFYQNLSLNYRRDLISLLKLIAKKSILEQYPNGLATKIAEVLLKNAMEDYGDYPNVPNRSNSKVTAKIKGFDDPLRETGSLIESVTARVRDT